jgi:hypothetical protein
VCPHGVFSPAGPKLIRNVLVGRCAAKAFDAVYSSKFGKVMWISTPTGASTDFVRLLFVKRVTDIILIQLSLTIG